MDAEIFAQINELRAELARQSGQINFLKLSQQRSILRFFKNNKRVTAILIALSIIIPVSLFGLGITKPFTFTAGNPTVASEVNANFDQLFNKVNDLAAFHPPIGTILAWHKSMTNTPSLPSSGEWIECNGQTLSDTASPYHNRVIPNLNGAASTGHFLRGSDTSGVFQLDAFQGHWHAAFEEGFAIGAAGPIYVLRPWGAGNQANGSSRTPTTDDGLNNTPRTATETRPVNMSVVWIMKVK